MSERRRRRSGGGGGGTSGGPKRWLTLSAVALVVLFLIGNLVVGWSRRDEQGRPHGLLSEEALAAIALWLPLGVAGAASLTGAWFAWEAHRRSERPATLWQVRGFVLSALFTIGLAVGTFELDRRWFAVFAALLFAVQTTVFAIAASRSRRRGAEDVARQAAAPSIPHAASPLPTDEAAEGPA